MFCLADNIYYNQIKSITKDDLISYYSFLDKINTDKDWDYFNIKQKNDITENTYNLKIGIETELNSLFLSSYSPENMTINKHIYKKLQYFSDKLKSIIMDCNKNIDFALRFNKEWNRKIELEDELSLSESQSQMSNVETDLISFVNEQDIGWDKNLFENFQKKQVGTKKAKE